MIILAELKRILCGDGRNFQKDNHHYNTPPIWALWQSQKLLLSERSIKSRLQFAKKYLKDSCLEKTRQFSQQ